MVDRDRTPDILAPSGGFHKALSDEHPNTWETGQSVKDPLMDSTRYLTPRQGDIISYYVVLQSLGLTIPNPMPGDQESPSSLDLNLDPEGFSLPENLRKYGGRGKKHHYWPPVPFRTTSREGLLAKHPHLNGAEPCRLLTPAQTKSQDYRGCHNSLWVLPAVVCAPCVQIAESWRAGFIPVPWLW